MKRLIFVIVLALLACIVSLVGCANNATQNDTEYSTEIPSITETDASQEPETQETIASESDTSETDINGRPVIINITDRTTLEPIMTASMLEYFFEDDYYKYYFGSIKSHYIIVEFSDGTIMNVKEAFELGCVTIVDLDRFNIGYGSEIRPDKAEVINIIDRTVTEMIPTDSALELFWQDEFCDYYLPSIRSEYVIVELNNGDTYYVNEALECGLITIKDLDNYNIQYITSKTREPAAEACVYDCIAISNDRNKNASPYATLFYFDEEYMYFYPNGAYEVELLYTNGYSEPLYSAIKRGTITFDEIDASSIEYFKIAVSDFGKCGIRKIVDLEALGYIKNEFPGGMYDDTFDAIYEDESFYYELHTPYEAAVIVVYNDNSTERVKDALAAGRAAVADLEKHGIPFRAYAKNISAVSLINSEIGGDMVFMWDSAIAPHDLFDHSVKITESLSGNMSCFSNYKLFERFADTIERNIIYYHDLFDTWEREETLDTLVSKYSKEWFDNNALILIHYSQGHYIENREITVSINKNAAADAGDILTVNMDTLNFGPDLGVDWFVFVEVAKEYIINCSEYSMMINEVPSLED